LLLLLYTNFVKFWLGVRQLEIVCIRGLIAFALEVSVEKIPETVVISAFLSKKFAYSHKV